MVRDRIQLADRITWKKSSFRSRVKENDFKQKGTEKYLMYLLDLNSRFLVAKERDRDRVGFSGELARGSQEKSTSWKS